MMMKKDLPGLNILNLIVDRIDQEEILDVKEVVTEAKEIVDPNVAVDDEENVKKLKQVDKLLGRGVDMVRKKELVKKNVVIFENKKKEVCLTRTPKRDQRSCCCCQEWYHRC